ncbi:MAG: DNA-3-methyladenine glycosylase [Nitrososphaerales archaeon]
MARLARRFFDEYTPKVARALLGSVLVRVVDGERISGMIVETEAYRGAEDPASHAYRGRTKRNDVMFGEGGHAYVYFTYGSHWCLNATTEPAGRAGAVLVRAVEPEEGLEKMLRNRGLESDEHLTDGPGKLTRALEIDSTLNGEDLVTSDRLFLEEGQKVEEVGSSSRVGIRQGIDLTWRFFVKGNRFVSQARQSPLRGTHN